MLGPSSLTSSPSSFQGCQHWCRRGHIPKGRAWGSCKPFKGQYSRWNNVNRAAEEATSEAAASGIQGPGSIPRNAQLGASAVQPSPASKQSSSVTFSVSHRVAFGQRLMVVGSSEELGAWNHAEGAAMEWSDGDTWTVRVHLTPGKHEFKLVVAGEGGRADWETGENRVIEIPDPVANEISQGDFGVVCEWCRTDTTLATPPERVADGGTGAVGVGAGQKGALEGAQASVRNMSVGKMEMEGGPPPPAPPPTTPGAPATSPSSASPTGVPGRAPPREAAGQGLGAPRPITPQQAQQSKGAAGSKGTPSPAALNRSTPTAPTPPRQSPISGKGPPLPGQRQQAAARGPAPSSQPPSQPLSSSSQAPAAASRAPSAGGLPSSGDGPASKQRIGSGGQPAGKAPGGVASQFDREEMMRRVAERAWEARMRAQGVRAALAGRANSRTRGQQQAAEVRLPENARDAADTIPGSAGSLGAGSAAGATSAGGAAGAAGTAGQRTGKLPAADASIWNSPGTAASRAQEQPGSAGAAGRGAKVVPQSGPPGAASAASPDAQIGDSREASKGLASSPSKGLSAGRGSGAEQEMGKAANVEASVPAPNPQPSPKIPGKMTVGKMEMEGPQEGEQAREETAATDEEGLPVQEAGMDKMTVGKMEIEGEGGKQASAEDAARKDSYTIKAPSQPPEAGKMTVEKMEVEGVREAILATPATPTTATPSLPQQEDQQLRTEASAITHETQKPTANEQVDNMAQEEVGESGNASQQSSDKPSTAESNNASAGQSTQQDIREMTGGKIALDESASADLPGKDDLAQQAHKADEGMSAIGKPQIEAGEASNVGRETLNIAASKEEPNTMAVGKMEVDAGLEDQGSPEEPPPSAASQSSAGETVGKMTVGKMDVDDGGEADLSSSPRQPSDSPAQTQSSTAPAGMQTALAIIGLLALPVVGWSEFQLNATGCGLPPGPYGALGAAEGIAYLSVAGTVLWSLSQRIQRGSGLPGGPGGMFRVVEGGSWIAAAAGAVVLFLQIQTYGYIPSALPDSNCYGEGSSSGGGAAAERFLPDLSAQLTDSLNALGANMVEAPSKLSDSLRGLQNKLPALLHEASPLVKSKGVTDITDGSSAHGRDIPPSQPASLQLFTSKQSAAGGHLAHQLGYSEQFASWIGKAAGGSMQGILGSIQGPGGAGVLGSNGCEASCTVQEQQLGPGAQLVSFREAFAGAMSPFPPLAQINPDLGRGPTLAPARDAAVAADVRGVEDRIGGGLPEVPAKVVTKAKEGLSNLADPVQVDEEPPLQKPVMEAVQKLKQTDVTPIMTTLRQVFGDLKEGFVGLAQTISSGSLSRVGEESNTLGSNKQEPQEQTIGVDVGGGNSKMADSVEGRKGSTRVGDNLRVAIERTDVQVASAAKEFGKRATALAQRVAEVAEGVDQTAAGQQQP